MTRTHLRWLLCLMFVAPIHAQGTLPASIKALVPEGAQVTSQTVAKNPIFVAVDFLAEKKLSGGHTATYNFHLLSYDTKSPLWKMSGPIYQGETAKKIVAKRASFGRTTNPPISYDAVKEAKYAWGTGFTQHVIHHYMGEGIGRDYVDGRAAYVGMTGGAMFELSVDGVRSVEEADQWAKIVANKAGALTPANIGN